METVLLGLAVLACPVGMGVMVWMMGRGMRQQSQNAAEAPSDIDQLRREHARLGAEIERLDPTGESERAGLGPVAR